MARGVVRDICLRDASSTHRCFLRCGVWAQSAQSGGAGMGSSGPEAHDARAPAHSPRSRLVCDSADDGGSSCASPASERATAGRSGAERQEADEVGASSSQSHQSCADSVDDCESPWSLSQGAVGCDSRDDARSSPARPEDDGVDAVLVGTRRMPGKIALSALLGVPKCDSGKWISMGSQYHGQGGCLPCKYHRSPKGCKDGVLCHLCHFEHAELSRHSVRVMMKRAALLERRWRDTASVRDGVGQSSEVGQSPSSAVLEEHIGELL